MKYSRILVEEEKMRTEEYYKMQSDCDDKCYVTEVLVEEREQMKCVTCPFCKKVVNAILTKSTIACPACKVEVKR